MLDLRGAANAHLHSGIASNTTATLKLRFTVINSGASYTIDDVEVDPLPRRLTSRPHALLERKSPGPNRGLSCFRRVE